MAYKIARWNPTDRCNFSCAYCTTPNKHTGNPAELTFEQIRDHLIPALREANVWEVNLLGGEPTLRKDILEIIRLLRESFLGVNLITNGSRLTPEMCQQLADLQVNRLHISMDSHLPEYNQKSRISKERQADFATQLNGIRFFANHPTTVLHINTVVSSLNYEAIPAYLDFLVEQGVKQVILIGEGRKEGVELSHPALTPAQLMELGKVVDQKMREIPTLNVVLSFLPLRARKYLNEHFGTTFSLDGIGGICKPGAYEIIVHSDGTVLPCNAFLTDDPELIAYFEIDREKMKVTNVPIMEICKSRTYQKAFQVSQTAWYRQSLRPCGKCEFLENGCYPCVFPRLTEMLHKRDWKPIIAQSFCQYISHLEGEKFNHYKINPEIVWHQEARQLFLYHPSEVEIITLTGLAQLLWKWILKGYTEDEMVEMAYEKLPGNFAELTDCQEKVHLQIDEWISCNYLHV